MIVAFLIALLAGTAFGANLIRADQRIDTDIATFTRAALIDAAAEDAIDNEPAALQLTPEENR